MGSSLCLWKELAWAFNKLSLLHHSNYSQGQVNVVDASKQFNVWWGWGYV